MIALPVARATADVTAKFLLQKIIYQFGCPQTFLTDNGTNFTSKIIPILNHKMGIGTSLTTPYHPEANGIVERANGTIVRILKKLVEENGVDWDLMVPTAVFAYNIFFHLVTKFSLFRLLCGREPAMPALTYPILLNEPIDGTEHYVMKLTRELI